jgi:hypothetical protein
MDKGSNLRGEVAFRQLHGDKTTWETIFSDASGQGDREMGLIKTSDLHRPAEIESPRHAVLYSRKVSEWHFMNSPTSRTPMATNRDILPSFCCSILSHELPFLEQIVTMFPQSIGESATVHWSYRIAHFPSS